MADILKNLHVNAQPTLNVASPLNDIQLVAIIAGGLVDKGERVRDAPEAVEMAMRIVAESIVRMQDGSFQAMVRQAKSKITN